MEIIRREKKYIIKLAASKGGGSVVIFLLIMEDLLLWIMIDQYCLIVPDQLLAVLDTQTYVTKGQLEFDYQQLTVQKSTRGNARPKCWFLVWLQQNIQREIWNSIFFELIYSIEISTWQYWIIQSYEPTSRILIQSTFVSCCATQIRLVEQFTNLQHHLKKATHQWPFWCCLDAGFRTRAGRWYTRLRYTVAVWAAEWFRKPISKYVFQFLNRATLHDTHPTSPYTMFTPLCTVHTPLSIRHPGFSLLPKLNRYAQWTIRDFVVILWSSSKKQFWEIFGFIYFVCFSGKFFDRAGGLTLTKNLKYA